MRDGHPRRPVKAERNSFCDLPPCAAWQHRESRRGFEVVFLGRPPHAWADGVTAAVEAGEAWSVQYVISFDERWVTHSALIVGHSCSGHRVVNLEPGIGGSWLVDGKPVPQLDGCLDVDLESSCLTNAFPVHRLGLGVGSAVDAPAAYVRVPDLRVERLEQRYTRLDDIGGCQRYHYEAPAFHFECELLYDETGLLLEYPGIGRRVA